MHSKREVTRPEISWPEVYIKLASRTIPGSSLVGIFAFALVPVELLLQAVLSLYGSAERGHRNFELLPTRCAHGNSGSAAKPFRTLIALFGFVILKIAG